MNNKGNKNLLNNCKIYFFRVKRIIILKKIMKIII